MEESKREPDRLTDAELAELERLEKEATPSTSILLDRYDHGGGRFYVPGNERLRGDGRKLVVDVYHKEDRELWATARGALPRLLTEVHTLRARVAELEAVADAARILDETTPLGDFIYDIREHEGLGWEGPKVTAWSAACVRLIAALAALSPKAKGGEG